MSMHKNVLLKQKVQFQGKGICIQASHANTFDWTRLSPWSAAQRRCLGCLGCRYRCKHSSQRLCRWRPENENVSDLQTSVGWGGWRWDTPLQTSAFLIHWGSFNEIYVATYVNETGRNFILHLCSWNQNFRLSAVAASNLLPPSRWYQHFRPSISPSVRASFLAFHCLPRQITPP